MIGRYITKFIQTENLVNFLAIFTRIKRNFLKIFTFLLLVLNRDKIFHGRSWTPIFGRRGEQERNILLDNIFLIF